MESLGTMLSDVSRSLFRRPATEFYPAERMDAPEQLRGLLHLDLSACTGCGLCAMDCPANALHVTVLDRKTKRFVMDYHVDRCAFCGQCERSCRQGALNLSSGEWELAQLDKAPFLLQFGAAHDVEEVLAGKPQGGTAPAKHE